MKGSELYAIRQRLGLSAAAFAAELGYDSRNSATKIAEYERGKRVIPSNLARMAWLVDSVYASVREEPPELWPEFVDDDGKIEWPEWPEEDEHVGG